MSAVSEGFSKAMPQSPFDCAQDRPCDWRSLCCPEPLRFDKALNGKKKNRIFMTNRLMCAKLIFVNTGQVGLEFYARHSMDSGKNEISKASADKSDE